MQQVIPPAAQMEYRGTAMGETIRPATVDWNQHTRQVNSEDTKMNDLIEKMSRMQAHINNMQAKVDTNRTVHRFDCTPATGTNTTPL